MPQGAAGGESSVHTAMAESSRTPVLMALTTAQIAEIGGRFLRAAFDAHATFFLVSEQGRLAPMADPGEGNAAQKTDKGAAIDTVLALVSLPLLLQFVEPRRSHDVA